MGTYLEHANITVPDIDAAIEFLRVIDPSVRVRHDEKPAGSYRWAHVAIGVNYIALQEPHVGSHPSDNHRPYKDHGVNHLGWVVEDLDKVVARLEEKGYRKGIPGEDHVHRRLDLVLDHHPVLEGEVDGSVGLDVVWKLIVDGQDQPIKGRRR